MNSPENTSTPPAQQQSPLPGQEETQLTEVERELRDKINFFKRCGTAFKQYPYLFLFIAMAPVTLVFSITAFIFNTHIDVLKSDLKATTERFESENRRFRLAAGIDLPDSSTKLSVLTNSELTLKALNLVNTIREMTGYATARLKNLDASFKIRPESSAEDSKRKDDQRFSIEQEEAINIESTIGVDTKLVLGELKRRIPEASRDFIMGSGINLRGISSNGKKAAEVPLIFPSDGMFGIFTLDRMPYLANELESLAKLLPSDVSKADGNETQSSPDTLNESKPVLPKLIVSRGDDLRNRTVLLDGYHYIDCKIDNTTFLYSGGPFGLDNCTSGIARLTTKNPVIVNTLNLLSFIGIIDKDKHTLSQTPPK